MSLTVKAFLIKKGEEKREIRRFTVPTDVSSNFSYLEKKIADIYPNLRQGNFKLFWTDPEGDQIAFSTDEELVEALGFIEDGIFRIKIKETSRQGGDEEQKTGGEGARHVGVVCDGCEGPIIGNRFKCMVCPDYDLCDPCEKKGIHTEHNMMKITAPVNGPFSGFCGGPGQPGFVPPPHFRRWMQRFMKRWHNKHQPGCDVPMEEDSKQDETNQDESSEDDYLRTIGESVQAMLDPFGIDVAVDVENHGRRQRCGKGGGKGKCGRGSRPQSCPGRQGPFGGPGCFPFGPQGAPGHFPFGGPGGPGPFSGCPFGGPRPQGQNEKKAETKQDDAPMKESTEKEIPVTTETDKGASFQDSTKKTQDQEDWTILTESTGASAPKPGSFSEPQPQIPSTTSLYPPVDPKISEALDTMMGMGFHNDGGWLSSLLQEKEGDIGKALDAIQQKRNRTSDGGYMA